MIKLQGSSVVFVWFLILYGTQCTQYGLYVHCVVLWYVLTVTFGTYRNNHFFINPFLNRLASINFLSFHLEHPQHDNVIVVVYAKLVEDRVPVSRAWTRMLCAAHVEAAEEHKTAVLRVLRVLQRLAWIRCAVDPTAKHAVRCKLEGRPPARLDVGDGLIGRAMEEERVSLRPVRAQRVAVEARPRIEPLESSLVFDLYRRHDVQYGPRAPS